MPILIAFYFLEKSIFYLIKQNFSLQYLQLICLFLNILKNFLFMNLSYFYNSLIILGLILNDLVISLISELFTIITLLITPNLEIL